MYNIFFSDFITVLPAPEIIFASCEHDLPSRRMAELLFTMC